MTIEKSISINDITRAASDVGFSVCGVAQADAVDRATADYYRRWIADGRHATMGYLAENIDKRLDPRLLHEGTQAIVCVALNYTPTARFASDAYSIAAYALGDDYHDVMKTKLHRMAAMLGADDYRAFCDTAPVLERYWAAKAGIGIIGRNRQLIVPGAGSMFFLGELFLKEKVTTEEHPELTGNNHPKPAEEHPELTENHHPKPASRCRACGYACAKHCPTGALTADGNFDARLCLSYHTIENRDAIPSDIAAKMGHCIYGCDRCQEVCPHNLHAQPTDCPELAARDALIAMTPANWQALSIEEYRQLFKGSAVKRAKYDGLMRNIKLIV